MNPEPSILLFPQPHEIGLERKTERCPRTRRKIPSPLSGRPDEYQIVFTETEIRILGSGERAFRYADQTLRSLEQRYGLDFIGHITDYADIPKRIAMIDLKRIVWKREALLRHLQELSDWKINGCLIEYEDKFPYENSPGIAHPRAFSKNDIRAVVREAERLGIELIPLVQCFSHWEYILRHGRYAPLREESAVIQQGCPRNPAVFRLFCAMAEEVIALHGNVRTFHIGGDEARLLGKCPACAEKVRKEGITALYGDYLAQCVRFLNEKGIHAYFWGDFYRHHDAIPQLKNLQCTAVDWAYGETSARAQSAAFPRIPCGRALFGTEEAARYAEVLLPDATTRTLFAFPHRKVIEKDGMRAAGAGNIANPGNILAHAEAAVHCGSDAVIGTYWASSNSLSMPYSVYELRKAGAALLGAAAWNLAFEQKEKKSFFMRFLTHAETKIRTGEELEFLHSLEHHFAPLPEIPDRIPGTNPIAGKLRLEKRLAQFRDARFFPPDTCVYPDLSPLFNSTLGFRVGDRECTFTDETLSFLPAGVHFRHGFPFRLENGLLLYGCGYDSIPSGTVIACERKKYAALSFLQSAVGGCGTEHGKWGELRLVYSDGSRHCEPLIQYDNLNAWYQPLQGRRTRIAFTASPKPSLRLGLHQFTLPNPFPEKELERIELESCSSGVIALAALTLLPVPRAPEGKNTIFPAFPGIRKDMEETRNAMKELLAPEIADTSAEELCAIAFGGIEAELGAMERISAFFQEQHPDS